VTLFDELVAALQPTMRSVAPFILTRLLLRAGVFDRAAMTVAELQRALPVIEAGLRESLAPGDLASTLDRIRDVVRQRELVSSSGSNVGGATRRG
jgi:hypothetical protein